MRDGFADGVREQIGTKPRRLKAVQLLRLKHATARGAFFVLFSF